MKKYIFTLVFIVLFTKPCFSQKDTFDCSTPNLSKSEMEKLPWYGNNQFLYDFLEDLEGNSNLRVERVFDGYQVGVQAWVYHKESGSSTVPEKWHILRWLNIVNDAYERNNVNIKLYLICDPVRVNSDKYYDDIRNQSDFDDMVAQSYNPNALNIHFIWDHRDSFRWAGLAKFPFYSNPYSLAIVTNVSVIDNDENIDNQTNQNAFAATLIHEIGHCFGLAHTHQGGSLGNNQINANVGECEQEYVDRNKMMTGNCANYNYTPSPFLAAEYNADAISDTPADPYLRMGNAEVGFSRIWVDDNCNYQPRQGNREIPISKDRDGVRWQPSGTNFMSYTRLKCMIRDNSITTLQKAAMYYYLENHILGGNFGFPPYPPNPIVHNDAEVDEYENDNDREVATEINLSSFRRQHHTIHPNAGALSNPTATCDEDWFKFDLSSPKKVIITTRPAVGNPDSDTFLKLFRLEEEAGSFFLSSVAVDDNSSPYGTGFSKIEEDNLSAGTYYARVTGSVGHYVIGFFPEQENWGNYPGGGTGGSGNGDGDIDISVGLPSGDGGDIDGDGTVDYLCDGAQIALTGLDMSDPNWSVQYSVNNSVSTISSTGLLQTNGFSGNITITVLIYYDGTLVGNVMETFWVGSPERPVLNIAGLRENNTRCEGEDIYFSTASTVQGFATHYKWKALRDGFVSGYEATTTTPFLGIYALTNGLPVGYYIASVSACNDCGCTESSFVDLTVLPISASECRSIAGKVRVDSSLPKELSIFPNPASNELNVQLPSTYEGETTYIELINSMGQVVVSQSHTKNKIKLSLKALSKGLYSLKIQNKDTLKVEKIVVE